jgi:F-type H+-transporting ATPase subunit epsilon
MSERLHLVIATPERSVLDADGITAVRARDASGSFGILPRHADLLTVLPPSVVSWRDSAGVKGFCAVRGGVLTVTGGREVAVACRQAQLGNRLEQLEAQIAATRAAEADAERRARVVQMKLHATAARQLMRYLVPGSGGLDDFLAERIK